MAKLQPNDRIAYTAKFLKITGQFTGAAPQRRGTFLRMEHGNFARVRWDDIEAVIDAAQGQFADAEYVDDMRRNGSLVNVNNIAKVGSGRFALNDL